MCCFSRRVNVVAQTNIFARASQEGRQYLVYSMKVDAPEPVAMILPIPVPANSAENAVKFINLEKYPDFFDELRAGFPEPPAQTLTKGRGPDAQGDRLPKVEVGAFVASFVPAVKDFSRLDEAFRLPTGVWDKLPQYKDFGFAVFQLKKGAQKVHPMAFEFPRINPRQLFFPTVHIHDGTVKEQARFDHALFSQQVASEDTMGWQESPQPAGLFMKKLDIAQGIIDPKAHCYRKIMVGVMKNADVILA